MGAGNMMGGGGGGSNPKINAKNRGAFAVGGMGRPGNGGGAGTIPGLNINRDRWKGFNADQKQGWRAFQQAGGKAGTGGGFGAFRTQTPPQQGAVGGGNSIPPTIPPNTGAMPPNTGPSATPVGNVDKQFTSSAALSNLISSYPQIASQLGGVLGQLGGQSGIAGGGGGSTQPGDGVGTTPPNTGPASTPVGNTPKSAGAFARQRRDQTPGIGGQDANWWRQVGYTPHFVSQLPGLLQQAGDYNYGGMDPSTVNWNDPRAIRRAAAFLPYDVSQYRSNGRGRGGGSVWNGWKPGDIQGRGMPLFSPPSMLPNSGGA